MVRAPLWSNPVVSLSKAHLLPQKVLVIPRKLWLRPNMTEKLFTGTLRINQPTNQPLAPSFLIGSSSYLEITRTSIIFQTCSNFSQILPRTAELAALERLKKIPWTYNLGTPTMIFPQNPLVTIKIQKEDLKFRIMSVLL